MKKIISLFASLSLLVASMAFAPVASAADEPTLVIDATKITDFTDYPSYNYGSEFDVYLISYGLTGLELETALGTGMFNKTKASGKSLSSYSIQYTIEINGDKNSAWMLNKKSALGAETLDTWNGKVHTFSYGNGSSMIYPAAGVAAKVAKSDVITVYEEIIVVAAGETFKITLDEATGCEINVSEFTDDSFKTGTRVPSIAAVSDVTVPMPEGGEEGGEGDEDEVTLVAGVDEITTEGRHNGKASISASKGVETTGLVKIVVTNDTKGEPQEWAAVETLGEGFTKVLPIITFDKEDMKGSTFTVKFLGAADAVLQMLTYKVQ